jgi:hypothetical protein
MSDSLVVEQPTTIDLLDQQSPALSSTTDIPVVETKPDSVAEAPAVKAEPTEPEVVAEEAEQPGESATPATDEDSGQQAGEEKPRGVGKALAELRQQRKEAEERARLADERLAQALAALERVSGKPADAPNADPQVGEPEPARPARTDYPSTELWEEALIDYADQKATWSARKEVKAAQAQAQQEAEARVQEEQLRVSRETYQARIQKVTEKYPDFKEVAETPDVQISMPMVHEIINSENGPELQYYLGKNPDEAKRIADMTMTMRNPQSGQIEVVPNIVAQVSEMRILAYKLANSTQQPTKPVVSNAPRPIKPITASAEKASKSLESMSMEEYAAKRKADWKSARH